MSQPFRLTLRELSPEALLRLSADAVRSATRRNRPDRFQPAGLVITELARAQSLKFEMLRLAMAHPDERVPLYLIDALTDTDRRALTAQWRAYIRGAALARGVAEAEREGHHWNPLLDALAAADQWPSERAYASQVASHGRFPLPVEPAPYRTRDEQAGRLHAWLGTADAAGLEAIWQARAVVVREHAARHGGKPTSELVDACLREPGLARAIASNANLAMSQVRRIADWILPRLTTPRVATSGVAASALTALERAGHRVPPDLVHALLAYASGQGEDAAERAQRTVALRALLTLERALAQEMLEQLAERAAADAQAGALLVRHPEAGPALWRTVARKTRHVAVQAQLLMTPAAAADPVVRKHLSSARESGILIGVIRNAEPAEAAQVYANLVRRSIEDALHVIEMDPESASRIPPSAVVALLRSEDPEVRERAIGALSNVGRKNTPQPARR